MFIISALTQLTSAPESTKARTLPSFTFTYVPLVFIWRVASSNSSCPPCSCFTAAVPSRYPNDPLEVEVAHNSPEVEITLRLLRPLGANLVSSLPRSVARRHGHETIRDAAVNGRGPPDHPAATTGGRSARRGPSSFVDFGYFGPPSSTVGRRREKQYAALFTCLAGRAVHTAVAINLSAELCDDDLRQRGEGYSHDKISEKIFLRVH
ncbi:hypothetical protein EVAR_43574_1 [Eumeta japonica]|uniref:Uncharacterized protein n=1 Tax=Eumeta variegata TaxID=151549 RepID=A0A4C1XHE7_EUMVA|nr:hypothetical protein EVAR_43574_1 [Eumeta japonica]